MSRMVSRRIAALALLLAAVLGCSPGFAQPNTLAPSEYALKAAFVYQFLSYVTWPPNKAGNGSIVIGIVDAPELFNNLAALARNQPAEARAIDVRNVPRDGNTDGLHVLFVNARAEGMADELLQAAVSDGVLTITESVPRPADSIINFEVIDNKVRFDVALGLARENGLDVSARLLQVALRVIEP
jgi:hypothetical protein